MHTNTHMDPEMCMLWPWASAVIPAKLLTKSVELAPTAVPHCRQGRHTLQMICVCDREQQRNVGREVVRDKERGSEIGDRWRWRTKGTGGQKDMSERERGGEIETVRHILWCSAC